MTATDPNAAGARPLRVVHLTTISDSLNLLLACEIETVAAAGVDVVGMSGIGSVGQVDPDVVLKDLNRKFDPRSDVRMAVDLYRQLRRLRPDVLHTHTPKAGLYGRVVGRVARVPIVVNTCHGLIIPPTGARWKRLVLAAIEGFAALFSHAELFQSRADHDRLRPVIRNRKMTVVGNGTDLQRFRFDPQQRLLARSALGIADDDIVVLGVGRRVRDKGVVEFCASADAIVQSGAVFMWAGGGEPDKADGLDVESSNVRALGHVSDMLGLYLAADIFVLPSYREGFPRSAMEAAATGLALVLSDIPGCRQLGDAVAVYVEPRNAEALTASIGRLIDDAEQRIHLSRIAQTRAAEAFDQRRVAASSLEAYRRVAERTGNVDATRIPRLEIETARHGPLRFPR